MNYQIVLFRISFKLRSFSQPCYIFLPFLPFIWIFPLQEVIKSILQSGRIGPDIQLAECYGLRLKHVKSDEIHWLHPDMTVGEVQDKYECLHLEAEWRYGDPFVSILFSPTVLTSIQRRLFRPIFPNQLHSWVLREERNRVEVQFCWDIFLYLFSPSKSHLF